MTESAKTPQVDELANRFVGKYCGQVECNQALTLGRKLEMVLSQAHLELYAAHIRDDALHAALSSMTAERDRLREELEKLNAALRYGGLGQGEINSITELWDRAERAEAELAECRVDAARYQWLRSKADRDDSGHPYIALDEWYGDPDEDSEPDQTVGTHWLYGPQADQAIDAAIADMAAQEKAR